MQITGKTSRKLAGAALSLSVATLTAAGFGLIATADRASAAPADMSRATAKYNGKDYQGALNEFKAITAKEPNNALAHYYLALCNQCLARVAEAKAEYRWVADHSGGALASQAQTGLSQLEKVNVRTGGNGTDATASMSSSSKTASAAGSTGEPSKDLIDRSSKDGKDSKDAKDKGTAAGDKTKVAAAPAKAADKVSKIINFYSDNSRMSITSEPAWDEVKTKYTKYTCQKVMVGDPLCEKYGISEFPTILILDKVGNILSTQGGMISADAVSSAVDNANSKK